MKTISKLQHSFTCCQQNNRLNPVSNGWLLFALGVALLGSLPSSSSAAGLGGGAGNWVPTTQPNTPVGVGQGIHPGRVVWVHDPTVTTFTGTGGYYGQDKVTSVTVAQSMLSSTIQTLTGATNDANAWRSLFTYFNQNVYGINVGYAPGETVAVKVNCENWTNAVGTATHNGQIDITPQMVKALLRELVTTAGVDQASIIVYDAQHSVSWISNYCASEFTNVVFQGNNGVNWPPPPEISFANRTVTNDAGILPDFVVNANYLINFATLKRDCKLESANSWTNIDGQTAISCCMKNQYGSSFDPSGMDASIRDWKNGMGKYNALVDLNGSQYLGGKTILYLIDGLFSGSQYNSTVLKWKMAPFNNYYPCSLFGSQDMVAIDSVALDFLRSEPNLGVMGNADNFLIEAAQAANPPSHTQYQPDGWPLASLGVHELWNNATNKQYTRNLSPSGTGIELIAIHPRTNGIKVAITSPASGRSFNQGSGVTIAATASTPYTGIRQIDFYAGTTLVGSSSSAPFSTLWTPPAATNFNLTAVATDDNGLMATSAVVTVTIVRMDFRLGVTPAMVSALAGTTVPFTVYLFTNKTYVSNEVVTLSVSDLPLGSIATLNPTTLTNDSSAAALTVFTPDSTAPGSYIFTISGTIGSMSNYTSANLIITNIPTMPGALIWTGGSTNGSLSWTARLNWTNPTAGYNGPPLPANDVYFLNNSASTAPGIINNVVDSYMYVSTLGYTNLNGAHTTYISPGATLYLSGGYGLMAGAAGNPTTLAVETNTITGPGAMALYGPLLVSQSANQTDAHNTTLDASGLGTFSMPGYWNYIYLLDDPLTQNYVYDTNGMDIYYEVYTGDYGVNVGQAGALNSSFDTAGCGTFYLPKTNQLAVTSLLIGNNVGATNSATVGSAVYLGQTNNITVDDVEVGMVNSGSALLAFKPGLTNPYASFQGSWGVSTYYVYTNQLVNGTLPAPLITTWNIADNGGIAAGSVFATNDFRGGYVTLAADILRVGRGSTNSTKYSGAGVLSFDNGLVTANELRLAEQSATTGGPGVGVVNVGSNATLTVGSIWMTCGAVSLTTPSNSATLNIIGGTVNAGFIGKVGGTATINIRSGGTLNITNSMGKPDRIIGSLTLTNSTFTLPQILGSAPAAYLTNLFMTNSMILVNLDGRNTPTNIVATKLTVRGTNVINIGSVVNLDSPAVFPLISYTTFSGAVATNFTVTNLPAGYTGQIINNTARGTIDLSIAPASSVAPQISGISTAGGNVLISGSGGLPGTIAYLLSSTNVALPLTNWTRVATNVFDNAGNFIFTNVADPKVPYRFFLMPSPGS